MSVYLCYTYNILEIYLLSYIQELFSRHINRFFFYFVKGEEYESIRKTKNEQESSKKRKRT